MIRRPLFNTIESYLQSSSEAARITERHQGDPQGPRGGSRPQTGYKGVSEKYLAQKAPCYVKTYA
jgi:hypothetical protein